MRILKLKDNSEIQISDEAGKLIWDKYLQTGKDGHIRLNNGMVIRVWDIQRMSESLPNELTESSQLLPEHRRNTTTISDTLNNLRKKLEKKGVLKQATLNNLN